MAAFDPDEYLKGTVTDEPAAAPAAPAPAAFDPDVYLAAPPPDFRLSGGYRDVVDTTARGVAPVTAEIVPASGKVANLGEVYKRAVGTGTAKVLSGMAEAVRLGSRGVQTLVERAGSPMVDGLPEFDAAGNYLGTPRRPETMKETAARVREGTSRLTEGALDPARLLDVAAADLQARTDVATKVDPDREKEFATKAVNLAGTVVPVAATGVVAPITGGLQAGGFARERAVERGLSPQEASQSFAINALGQGALGFVPLPGINRAAGAIEQATQNIVGEGLRRTVKTAAKAGAGATIGAGTNTAGGAAIQLLDTGKIDPQELLYQAALGGAVGAVGGVTSRGTPSKVPERPGLPSEGVAAGAAVNEPEIGAIRAALEPEYQVTIQRAEVHPETGAEIPGYVQIDEIVNGENTRSVSPEVLAAEGKPIPIPEHLPSGRYSHEEITRASRDPFSPASGETKPLGLLESAKRSEEIAAELKDRLNGTYEVKHNVETLAEAKKQIDSFGSIEEAKSAVMNKLEPDAVSNAMGLDLVRKFQSTNRLSDAADVLFDMAVKAKSQGQAIQILSTLSRSTPEGLAAYAQRIVGRKLTEAELNGINQEAARVQSAADPAVRLARQAQLLGKLEEMVPLGAASKLRALANMAMLLNPKTQIRNVLGNILMAGPNLAVDMLSPVVDAGVSVFNGKRAVHGVGIKDYFEGLAIPIKEAVAGFRQARTEGASRVKAAVQGAEVVSALAKLGNTTKMEIGDVRRAYRMTFSQPLLRGMERTLNVMMGVPDRIFYMGRLNAAVKSIMRAADAVAPTAEMIDRASLEAARAVYQDRNFISQGLNKLQRGANFISTLGRTSEFGLGQAITPFTQVPGAIVQRGLEFSPAGFVKSLALATLPVFTKRAFNQREFTQSFTKALIGTGGLVGAGALLAELGIVTGRPTDDPKVRELERSLGYGAYKINVSELKRRVQSMDWTSRYGGMPRAGDMLVSYDWAQPMAMPLAIGADLSRKNKEPGAVATPISRVAGAMMSGVKTLEEQPLLTGLTGFMARVGDASRGDKSVVEALGATAMELPGQFVPTVVRQITQLMDNRVYETRGSDKLEAAFGRIAVNLPGLAGELGYKPRTDLMGDVAERYQANGNSFVNVVLSPAFVTRAKSDPQLREMYRIWQKTGESGHVPNAVDSSIVVNGEQKSLTASERADLQQFVGRTTRDAFRQLMRAPGYRLANDERRAKVLGDVASASTTVGKVLLFGHRPKTLGRFERALLRSPAVQDVRKTAE